MDLFSIMQVLSKLVQDSRNPPEPALIPSRGFLTPPGGQLVHTLVVQSASAVYGLAATSDGRYAVTGIPLSLHIETYFFVFPYVTGLGCEYAVLFWNQIRDATWM